MSSMKLSEISGSYSHCYQFLRLIFVFAFYSRSVTICSSSYLIHSYIPLHATFPTCYFNPTHRRHQSHRNVSKEPQCQHFLSAVNNFVFWVFSFAIFSSSHSVYSYRRFLARIKLRIFYYQNRCLNCSTKENMSSLRYIQGI